MPVPPNQTATTAISIGTLTGYTAYTTTQDAWDGSITAQDLWYSYTPVAGDKGLEIYGYGNGTTYIPILTVYSGPASAPVLLDNSHSSLSKPVQQDIQTFRGTGEPILIRFRKFSGNNNPSILTLRIARWKDEPITNGELFINDSSPGYPGIAMARASAIPTRYELNYPAGEGQQILRNGIVGAIDAFDLDGVVLYDVAADGFTVRFTPTMPDSHYTAALASNQLDTFWALSTFGGGNSHAVSISSEGVVGTPLDLGGGGTELTPNADNSVLYVISGTDIVQVTNPGGVRTAFLSVDAGYAFAGANILMMTDDTLLVPYDKAAAQAYVKQFDLDATLLNTILLPVEVGTKLERLFADPSDPLYFWIWWQTTELNHFQRIRVSDGVVVEDLSRMKFIESVSQTADATASTIYSGADFSCVPIVLRLSATTTYPIRRQRRFLLPSSPDNKRIQIPTLELLMRTGIGTNDTPDPQVMMRISKDGGKTWGPERWRSAGAVGRYADRVRWLRATGNYRNAVCEITVSDPVDWQWLAMMADPTEGSS